MTRMAGREERGPAMSTLPSATHRGVLLLGATGRTGSRVLIQLLERGVPVRAIVRSAERLPAGSVDHALLTVVEADLASVSAEALGEHVDATRAVLSCLGHTMSLRGVFGPPRDLVERVVRAVGRAAEAQRPASPVRLVLMSSVSVHRPAGADARRGAAEHAFVAVLRALLPPARDNQRAADYLTGEVRTDSTFLEWVIVRPDTLVDGEASAYRVEEQLVASLFKPDTTRMANVAHFMVDLATDEAAWRRWRGRMPVVVDDGGRIRARVPEAVPAPSGG